MINTEFIRNNILTFGLELVSEKAILEILDHLEAVESECLEQSRLNGMGASREAALMAKLEAAEKERDNANAVAVNIALEAERLQCENDTLRAKIAERERQVPVAEWTENRFHHYPQLVWNEKYRATIGAKLYALPGAQGEG